MEYVQPLAILAISSFVFTLALPIITILIRSIRIPAGSNIVGLIGIALIAFIICRFCLDVYGLHPSIKGHFASIILMVGYYGVALLAMLFALGILSGSLRECLKRSRLYLLFALLFMGLPALAESQAPLVDYYLKGNKECLSCHVVKSDTSIVLLKASLPRLYSKWMRRGLAGGSSFTLQRPEGTTLKISMNDLVREELKPENHTHLFNVSTAEGHRYKNVFKELVNYDNEYVVFSTEGHEKITLPFSAIDYIVNVTTGEMLYNGIPYREKIAGYQQSRRQNDALAFGLLSQQLATQQRIQQESRNLQPYQYTPLPVPQRININCNTMGNFTSCTGW